jgi:hypothetical protein
MIPQVKASERAYVMKAGEFGVNFLLLNRQGARSEASDARANQKFLCEVTMSRSIVCEC